jgi:hypothetical protein
MNGASMQHGGEFTITEIVVCTLQNNTPNCQISCDTLPEHSIGINKWQTIYFFKLFPQCYFTSVVAPPSSFDDSEAELGRNKK